MYMISLPSREPGIEARMPIVFGAIPAGGSAGSQKFTVAHRWRDLSTVMTLRSEAPEATAGSATAATSRATTIPVRDDTTAA